MWTLTSIAVLALLAGYSADAQDRRRYPRAAPPQWPAEEVSRIFYDDAFRGALVGDRPRRSLKSDLGTPGPTATVTDDDQAGLTAGHGWSQFITRESLEDEVKRQARQLALSVTTPAQFAGQGYQDARRIFTNLAVLFGVIREYDGDVRWRDDAGPMRDRCAHMAAICKVGTQQVFQAAKQRLQELNDLVRGDSLANREFDQESTWGDRIDRAPLMEQMEVNFEDRIAKWTASVQEFRSRKDELGREAQLLAVCAHVLILDGMADRDDETYRTYCERLAASARQIVRAVEEDDYDQARKETGEIRKSCSECHELYRG